WGSPSAAPRESGPSLAPVRATDSALDAAASPPDIAVAPESEGLAALRPDHNFSQKPQFVHIGGEPDLATPGPLESPPTAMAAIGAGISRARAASGGVGLSSAPALT